MSLMLEESLEAPERVAGQLARDADLYAALGERLRQAPPPAALTIARGSSDNAAAYGAYLLTLLAGVPVASLPPSLVTLERARLAVEGHLALAVSQSGRSPDIVACLEAAHQAGAVAVAVVNDPASPLADAADTVLPQHAGPERSVAATKSFITSLTAIARLAVAWRPDPALAADLERLPDRLRRAAQLGLAADPGWTDGARNVYVLARGAGLPVAQEVALKLKETCGLHAEAFSSAELRHGPREIVDARFAVLALALAGPGQGDVLAAARELASQGATVRVCGPAETGDSFLTLSADLDPRLAPIEAVQALYPLLARTATRLGRDPDRPRTLAKVTETL
jgi:glucosamine--fructose-6-phosphate aminotransferase (isomerizing)